ncbi:MAG: hypothetical protein MZU97_20220 [Bacillus subtilis]|nr:hypothetical protein [Bacillus subtilis]
MPLIVLGYERYGKVTGVKKNSNFEYDEDFVNLSLRDGNVWEAQLTLKRTIETMLQEGDVSAEFRLGGDYQVAAARQGGVLKEPRPPKQSSTWPKKSTFPKLACCSNSSTAKAIPSPCKPSRKPKRTSAF